MKTHPAFRLFCLALGGPPGAPDLRPLCEAVEATADWPAMIEGVRRHRVAPLVLTNLQASGAPCIPPEVLMELQQQSRAAAQRSLAQAAEVARLQGAFAEQGLRVLFLKGVVLSAQLFGDAARREARDVDLLVDPAQFAAAAGALEALGYRRSEYARSPRQSAQYARLIKDVEFRHALTRAPLELHHRLSDNPRFLSVDFDALWREREMVRVGEVAVPALPRRILPLYLCAHGAGHAWERLRWLVDFAAALTDDGRVDEAVAAADAHGLGAPMLHALMLAHDWLGLPVAARHLAHARASAAVRRLDRILAHLYAGAAWHVMPPRGTLAGVARYGLWQRLYRMSLRADWRYRLDQARREWFTPADWATLRLPDALFLLYPIVRPVGWLMRRLQR